MHFLPTWHLYQVEEVHLPGASPPTAAMSVQKGNSPSKGVPNPFGGFPIFGPGFQKTNPLVALRARSCWRPWSSAPGATWSSFGTSKPGALRPHRGARFASRTRGGIRASSRGRSKPRVFPRRRFESRRAESEVKVWGRAEASGFFGRDVDVFGCCLVVGCRCFLGFRG